MLDLIIKNGRLVTGEKIEIGITAGKIIAVEESLSQEAKATVSLAPDEYLSAGWIDGHVHCYQQMELYYDFPDEIGINKGVTTIVDAGSTGALNIPDFYQRTRLAKTNVLALINLADYGIIRQDELADLTNLNPQHLKQAIEKFPDFIIGLKARMSKSVVGNNGVKPLVLAKKLQQELNLPLMVHIGSAPPALKDILALLTAGDIVTHCFNGKENGILASDDLLKEFVWEAYRRGIVFDIGHGTDSFNFHVAEAALAQKMVATTISTDIYYRNRENGPVYDLATTLEKLWQVGYDLADLIEKVTSQPANYLNLKTKGQLKVGFDGDLTIFKLTEEAKNLIDSDHNQRQTNKQIIPCKTIVGGTVYDIN